MQVLTHEKVVNLERVFRSPDPRLLQSWRSIRGSNISFKIHALSEHSAFSASQQVHALHLLALYGEGGSGVARNLQNR